MIETYVVVEKGSVYTGGKGYTGYVLRELGFPEGPYILGTAKILVRQAATVNSKLKLVITKYIP